MKSVRVSFWIFVPVLVWAVSSTIFLFFRNPLPFPDRGHRCFAVPDEDAAKVVVALLGELGDLPERFTFDAGSTHQTLLWDNTTVIIRHDKIIGAENLEPNAISVVVDDPAGKALLAANILKKAGFTAIVKNDAVSEARNKLAVLSSDAFDGWVMVFRRHVLAMGRSLKTRKIATK